MLVAVAKKVLRCRSALETPQPLDAGPERYLVFGYDEHWHHRGQLYT